MSKDHQAQIIWEKNLVKQIDENAKKRAQLSSEINQWKQQKDFVSTDTSYKNAERYLKIKEIESNISTREYQIMRLEKESRKLNMMQIFGYCCSGKIYELEQLKSQVSDTLKQASNALTTAEMEKKTLSDELNTLKTKLDIVKEFNGEVEDYLSQINEKELALQDLNQKVLELKKRLHILEMTADPSFSLNNDVNVETPANKLNQLCGELKAETEQYGKEVLNHWEETMKQIQAEYDRLFNLFYQLGIIESSIDFRVKELTESGYETLGLERKIYFDVKQDWLIDRNKIYEAYKKGKDGLQF